MYAPREKRGCTRKRLDAEQLLFSFFFYFCFFFFPFFVGFIDDIAFSFCYLTRVRNIPGYPSVSVYFPSHGMADFFPLFFAGCFSTGYHFPSGQSEMLFLKVPDSRSTFCPDRFAYSINYQRGLPIISLCPSVFVTGDATTLIYFYRIKPAHGRVYFTWQRNGTK